MNGWYPKLSRDAQGLCSGNDEIWVNGRLIERGYAPVWLDDQQIIWTRYVRDPAGASLPGDGIGLRAAFAEGGPGREYNLNTGPINEKAAGAGMWAVWNPADGIRWWDGTRSPDSAQVSISADGHRAWVDNWKSLNKTLRLDGGLVLQGNVTFVKVSEQGALAWTIASTSGMRSERTWVCLPGQIPRDISLSNAEFFPQLVLTPRGWLVLVYQVGPNRLTLRPVGESRGWIVRNGSTRDPDARWNGSRVRVVSCNDLGGLQDDIVDTSLPQTALSPDVPPITIPPPTTVPVKATIESYAPSSGTAPLNVRAVAKVTQGKAASFDWQIRKAGAMWTTAVVNPASDLDHTFTKLPVGSWEIRLHTIGVGEKNEDMSGPRSITVK